MAEYPFVPLSKYREYPPAEMQQRASAFREEMLRRRTVRYFSDRPVAREIIEDCLMVAGSAPSGANLQPWHFAVVSDPAIKQQIRAAAEKEEYAFYHGRAPQEWLDALAPLGTDMRMGVMGVMGEMGAITPISPITPILSSSLFIRFPRLAAMLQSHTRHRLAQAAFLDEMLFNLADLLIEQVICLVNQANRVALCWIEWRRRN